MTYIPRDEVTKVIANKFEAVRVLSLECRRLNDEMRAREQHTEKKIASMAVKRLFDGEVEYYDARERREQERSEAMLAAAEGILDAAPVEPPTASIGDVSDDGEEAMADAAAAAAEEAKLAQDAETPAPIEASAESASAELAAEPTEEPTEEPVEEAAKE